MKLYFCDSPIYIKNPYTGLKQYVACGKCAACRRGHNAVWVQRLEQEFQCWPYAAFVTLTYDDSHLHIMHYDKDVNHLISLDSSEVLDCSSISNFNYKDKLYLFKRDINVVNKSDCQKFLKRLRYYIHQLHINPLNLQKYGRESEIIRYFLVSEYGPTTLRAHYHCLFFFKSKLTASNFETLLSKAWQNGRCDFSFCSSSGASSRYVAQYLTCSYNLPKIYSLQEIKPFCLFSKHPAIGTLQVNSAEIRRIFDNAAPTRQIYNREFNEFEDVPLWLSLQDSLFPKIAGFGGLSHAERVALYGSTRFFAAENFEEFKSQVIRYCKLYITPSGIPSYTALEYLAALYCRCLKSGKDYSLMRLYLVSRRVLAQAEVFNVSLDYYVSKIEQYYSNKDYYKLTKWLEFQQEFVSNYPVSDILYADLDYIARAEARIIFRSDGSYSFDSRDILIFDSFGEIPSLSKLNDCLTISSSRSDFNAEIANFIRKSTKSKKKNDYLNAHPEYRYLY